MTDLAMDCVRALLANERKGGEELHPIETLLPFV
jgi:hypothetical protein